VIIVSKCVQLLPSRQALERDSELLPLFGSVSLVDSVVNARLGVIFGKALDMRPRFDRIDVLTRNLATDGFDLLQRSSRHMRILLVERLEFLSHELASDATTKPESRES